MQIARKNFALAKAIKTFGDPDGRTYALHLTKERTEITNGNFAIQMRHSAQSSFEFLPEHAVDVLLSPEDAINIASTLGKDGNVKAVIAAGDRKSVQIEFDSGEIRILPLSTEPYPNITSVVPTDPPLFSIALNPDFMIAILQAFQLADLGSVLCEFRGSNEPVVLRPQASGEEPIVQAVIAPMRATGLIDIAPHRKRKHVADSESDEEQRSIPMQ